MRRAKLVLAFLVAAVAAPQPSFADKVTCADGTTSESGRGACSHHGGIAKTRAEKRDADKADAAPRRKTTTRTKTTRKQADDVPSIIVRCEDGSISWATGKGACSHHGGIAERERTQPTRTEKRTEPRTQSRQAPRSEPRRQEPGREEARADKPWWMPSDETVPGRPMARCRDGSISYSKSHRGTCSHHGGVREWLD